MAVKRDTSNLIVDSRVEGLQQYFEFRRPEEVSEFLLVNPFLLELLPEAQAHIKRNFPESKLFLELFPPVEDGEEPHLVIYITTALGYKEASIKLDRLDEDWWIETFGQTQGKLNIDLEFR